MNLRRATPETRPASNGGPSRGEPRGQFGDEAAARHTLYRRRGLILVYARNEAPAPVTAGRGRDRGGSRDDGQHTPTAA